MPISNSWYWKLSNFKLKKKKQRWKELLTMWITFYKNNWKLIEITNALECSLYCQICHITFIKKCSFSKKKKNKQTNSKMFSYLNISYRKILLCKHLVLAFVPEDTYETEVHILVCLSPWRSKIPKQLGNKPTLKCTSLTSLDQLFVISNYTVCL